MKQQSIATKLGVLFLTALFLGGCAGTGETTTTTSPQNEQLLTQAGFKTKTVTTPKQQKQVSALPANKVSAVKYHGKIYYVYPGSARDQVYVGSKKQYEAYKQLRQSQPAAAAEGTQANSFVNPKPTMTYDTTGPDSVVVQEFDGFGPLLPEGGD
jgi:hypothetical protein